MKNLLITTIALLLMVTATSCGNNRPEPSGPVDTFTTPPLPPARTSNNDIDSIRARGDTMLASDSARNGSMH